MKNRITNPFITGGYVSPEYFCNRHNETEYLLKAISSRRNVTLISLRRMGKTGILKHVKYILEQTRQAPAVLYIDLMPTMSGNEMLNTLSSALLRLKQHEKNFFEKVLTTLASLRPRLTYDSLTQQPSLELKVESPAELQFGFDNLLRIISDIKQDLVFMFDEFQQINHYQEKNIEEILRSIIQSYPTIPYIFSGSSKHMLEPMFSSVNRPFYQSAELMYLEEIPEQEYKEFIIEKFKSGSKSINDADLSRIFKWTRLHTFYVQYVCNLLFESDKKIIDTYTINEIFHRILVSYEPLYNSFRNLLTAHQLRLLQAIAVEDGIEQPTSGAFINDHNLVSASSVSTSLKALAVKEMIVQRGKKWIVYDVFLSRWLEYLYGNR